MNTSRRGLIEKETRRAVHKARLMQREQRCLIISAFPAFF